MDNNEIYLVADKKKETAVIPLRLFPLHPPQEKNVDS